MTTLIALQALGKGQCAKRFLADGSVESYGRTTFWRPIRARITSLAALYEALRRLAARPDLCVIRGEPIDPSEERMLRRIHRRGDTDPTFRDADRMWLCVDLDRTAPPPGMPITAENAVAYLRTLLPAWLARAGVVLQWSQSAGRDSWTLLKAHLWFWLDRPACSASLHRWAKKHKGIVDVSLFNPVQPHYTADPIIEDGWTGRPTPSVVIFDGPPAVVPAEILCLADEEARAERERNERAAAAERAERALRAGTDPSAIESQARASMRRLGLHEARKILTAGEGGRHPAIVTAVKAVAALGRELGVSHHAALRDVAAAAESVLPAARHREIGEIIKAVG